MLGIKGFPVSSKYIGTINYIFTDIQAVVCDQPRWLSGLRRGLDHSLGVTHAHITKHLMHLYNTQVLAGCLFVGVLTSLCHSNGHIETMPAREINPFTALTRIRSQFLRTQ